MKNNSTIIWQIKERRTMNNLWRTKKLKLKCQKKIRRRWYSRYENDKRINISIIVSLRINYNLLPILNEMTLNWIVFCKSIP